MTPAGRLWCELDRARPVQVVGVVTTLAEVAEDARRIVGATAVTGDIQTRAELYDLLAYEAEERRLARRPEHRAPAGDTA